MAITESVDLYLSDFGVACVANGVSGLGILDQNSEVILGGEITIIDYLLTVPTDLFGSLAYGDQITVDGIAFKVEQQPMRFDDGRFSKVPLVRVG